MSNAASINTTQLRDQGWNTNAPTLSQIENGGYVLMEGHAGEAAQKVQDRLVALGYPVAAPGKDGRDAKFGTDSRLALEEFQRRNGLTDDGKLGQLTYQKLFGSEDVKTGPGRVVRDHVRTGGASSAERDRIRNATGTVAAVAVDPKAKGQLDSALATERKRDLRANTEAGKPIFDGTTSDGPKWTHAPDLTFGTGNNLTMKDYRGEVVAKGADYVSGGFRAQASLAEAKGTMDLGGKFGADGKVALVGTGELGVTGAAKRDANGDITAVSGRAGAYVGADLEGEANLSARWFGIGVKKSVGVGAGAQAELTSQNDADRMGASMFVRGGLGVTAGVGAQFYVDKAQIAKDYNAASKWVGDTASSASKWVGDTASWAGNGISKAWNSIDWTPSDARP